MGMFEEGHGDAALGILLCPLPGSLRAETTWGPLSSGKVTSAHSVFSLFSLAASASALCSSSRAVG